MAGRRRQVLLTRGTLVAAVVGAWLAVPAACSSQQSPEIAVHPTADGSLLEASREPDADRDSQPDVRGAELDGDLPDGPLTRVDFGVNPEEVNGEGGAAGARAASMPEATLAELDVLSVGTRARSLVVRFDALCDRAGVINDAAFDELSRIAALYRERNRRVLFSVAVVDRASDARPALLRTSWSDPALRAALTAIIDRSYDMFGPELAYLTFGTDVDRFLASLAADERDAFADFVGQSLTYAKARPTRFGNTQIAATFSLAGLAGQQLAQTGALLRASEVAVATDDSLDHAFHALPPDAELKVIAGLPDALRPLGKGSLVLQSLGYPSATGAGSSTVAQRRFYHGLAGLIEAHRGRYPFVAIDAMSDAEETVCAERARTFGATSDPFLIAALCSLGLKDSAGSEKPAWAEVVGALSQLGKP